MRAEFDIGSDEASAPVSRPETLEAATQPASAKESPQGLATPSGVHLRVFGVAAFGYVWIMAVFWLLFYNSPTALFMVVVSSLFLAVYLGVPGALMLTGKAPEAPERFKDFWQRRVDTWTGELKGSEAALQIILIPLALAVGITIIGTIIAFVR